jgi:hypothetical protein
MFVFRRNISQFVWYSHITKAFDFIFIVGAILLDANIKFGWHIFGYESSFQFCPLIQVWHQNM